MTLLSNFQTSKEHIFQFPHGLPVMVYVHGGGFTVHSSANYGDTSIARNLCTKGVLVCTINYRLGVMGFFTTGDQRCLGKKKKKIFEIDN